MYIKSILFRRKDESWWNAGLYIGKRENSPSSTILDEDYRPVLDEVEVKDYTEKPFILSIDKNVG